MNENALPVPPEVTVFRNFHADFEAFFIKNSLLINAPPLENVIAPGAFNREYTVIVSVIHPIVLVIHPIVLVIHPNECKALKGALAS